jgi:uncharacterized integral membrane protein (TIGR00698 family)
MLAGILAVSAIVAFGWWANERLDMGRFGLNTLSVSLFIGMLLGNMLRLPGNTRPGIVFAQQRLLRLGVMLFGLHVSVGELLHVGGEAFTVDLIVMAVILIGGSWLGIRVFGLDRDLAIMTAAGSAICGAAAVLATEPVVKGNSAHTSMAVASVVLFGTIAILLYPLIYHFSHTNSEMFGIYVGATVHEVAQVVAVGHSINERVEQTAVIVKLMRVMLLAPVLLLLSVWWRNGGHAPDGPRHRIIIPWFAFGFIAVVVINSVWAMSPALHKGLEIADTLMLAAAMAALGLETRFAQMRALGIKPLAFAGVLFLILVLGGDLLTHALLGSTHA